MERSEGPLLELTKTVSSVKVDVNRFLVVGISIMVYTFGIITLSWGRIAIIDLSSDIKSATLTVNFPFLNKTQMFYSSRKVILF